MPFPVFLILEVGGNVEGVLLMDDLCSGSRCSYYADSVISHLTIIEVEVFDICGCGMDDVIFLYHVYGIIRIAP